jgi:hypothetical protein
LRFSKSGAQRASRHLTVAMALLVGLAGLASLAPAPTSAATSVEVYYLRLLNCTRTGGWVRTDGSCAGYGSGRYSSYVRPLSLSAGISDRVSRPYARLLAIKAQCTHTLNGTSPGTRLAAAGYRSYNWGENIGCRDGYSSAFTAVLQSHLNFQSERSYNGGHWRNIKSTNFTMVGVGIYRYGSRTRLVTDFYRPLG